MNVFRGFYAQQRHKLICILAIMTILMPLFVLQAHAESPYPFTAEINADRVNMRRRPSASSIVLERIPLDSKVTVLGDVNSYYKVLYNERTGYVIKTFVGSGHPIKNDGTSVADYPYLTSTNANVKLRKRPSTKAVVLAYISEGDTVIVQENLDSFVKAEYNGSQGYIMSEFVNLIKVEQEEIQTPNEEDEQITFFSQYEELQLGSEGASVKALQSALVELGFLKEKEIDGLYGALTEKAVKALQEKNDLEQTGIADTALQAFIYANKPRNVKGKATQIKTLAPIEDVVIRPNNIGDGVTALQNRLVELLYEPGEANGIYNKQTISAVRHFQQKNGITVDGLAGRETRDILYSLQAVPADQPDLPKATPLPSPPPGIFKIGDNNNDIMMIQQRLLDLGYYRGNIDGIYGKDSAKAIEQFQQGNDLYVDGIAGKETLEKLFSLEAAFQVDTLQTPPPITEDNFINIKLGISGDAVLRLQKRLTELNYYSSRNDGLYLADDIAAVRTFQRNNGLTIDGVAGYNTQLVLFSENAVSAFSKDTISGETDEIGLPQTIRLGDIGDGVKEIQNRLIELGYMEKGSADGNYGLKTAEAVVEFQKANSLLRDGIVGSKTRQQLYSSKAIAAKKQTVPDSKSEYLSRGDRSEAVKSMQTKLISLGYLTGKADGVFGIDTYLALQTFQLRNGLSADGIAGALTLGTLDSSNAKPAQSGGTQIAQPPTSLRSPRAAQVSYMNWYEGLRTKVRNHPILTVYDFSTGLSWQVNAFSIGAHADAEPLTSSDTANMLKAFGGKQTWTPKAVWIVLTDGSVYMGSTHSYGHDVDHTPGNNLAGHICIHFPRTQTQVAAIGKYATSHQATIDEGWMITQNMIR